MEKNIKILIGVIVVVGVLVALYFLFISNQQVVDNKEVTETPLVQDTNNDAVSGVIVSNTSLSYSEALVKYANRRIQLDQSCQAHPNTVTYKDNTGIMIDNRSDKTRTVKIGTTFTIKPYGFKIVTFPDLYFQRQTIFVDCDGSQNVATIVVQE